MVRYSIEIGQQEQDILKEIVLASDKNVKKRKFATGLSSVMAVIMLIYTILCFMNSRIGYVHVQVNNSGTIINISYVEGVDINKSLEENLMQTEKDFATLQKSFENLNVSVSNPEILSYQAIPQQFKDEFLNGTFYKSFRFYDQDAPISLSCSFDTETEDQFDEYTRPKIDFFLGSK